MKAYVICIVGSLILNIIAERLLKKNKNKVGLLFLLASLFMVCFIAGVRSDTVGRDVNLYVKRLVNLISITDDFFMYLINSNSDFLFSVTVYIGYLNKNLNTALFCIELMVALPIYIYAYKERKNKSIAITLLIFMLTMYCVSFNLLRQSIAISLCVLAYHYFNEKKYKKALLIQILSMFFHKTSIIFLVVFVFNFVINSNIKSKSSLISIIMLGAIIVSFFSEQLILLTPYARYIDNGSLMRDFSLGSIIKKIFWVLLPLMCCNRIRDEKSRNNLKIGLNLSIISLILVILSFKIPGTGRVGYYFTDISYFLLIPEIPKAFKEKTIVNIGLLVIVFVLWWHMTAVENDNSEVYPYKSNICTFLN